MTGHTSSITIGINAKLLTISMYLHMLLVLPHCLEGELITFFGLLRSARIHIRDPLIQPVFLTPSRVV